MHGPSTSDHIGPALLRRQDFHRGSPQDSPGAALGRLEPHALAAPGWLYTEPLVTLVGTFWTVPA